MRIRYARKIDNLVVIMHLTVDDEHCWQVIDLMGKHFGVQDIEARQRIEIILRRNEARRKK